MHFEKISYGQWVKDWSGIDNPQIVEDIYNHIKLPQQATKGSAGMDFFAPCPICLESNSTTLVPTGIRWIENGDGESHDGLDHNYVLSIYPRSGLGFKHGIGLANTIGVIDADYSESSNEGHIMIKLVNPSDECVTIDQGKAFAQGIITECFICSGAKSLEKRNGGFGSTDNTDKE